MGGSASWSEALPWESALVAALPSVLQMLEQTTAIPPWETGLPLASQRPKARAPGPAAWATGLSLATHGPEARAPGLTAWA